MAGRIQELEALIGSQKALAKMEVEEAWRNLLAGFDQDNQRTIRQLEAELLEKAKPLVLDLLRVWAVASMRGLQMQAFRRRLDAEGSKIVSELLAAPAPAAEPAAAGAT
jgi:hypothetical protein